MPACDEEGVDQQLFTASCVAYSLSFSEAFYCDGDLDAIRPSKRPLSVYQAILSIRRGEWEQIARDVFGAHPDRLDPLAVLDRIRETNTCSNLESPVWVWIDRDGDYQVPVHDP